MLPRYEIVAKNTFVEFGTSVGDDNNGKARSQSCPPALGAVETEDTLWNQANQELCHCMGIKIPGVPQKPAQAPAAQAPPAAPAAPAARSWVSVVKNPNSEKCEPGKAAAAPQGKGDPGKAAAAAPQGKGDPGKAAAAPQGKGELGKAAAAPQGKGEPGKAAAAPQGKAEFGKAASAPQGKGDPRQAAAARQRPARPAAAGMSGASGTSSPVDPKDKGCGKGRIQVGMEDDRDQRGVPTDVIRPAVPTARSWASVVKSSTNEQCGPGKESAAPQTPARPAAAGMAKADRPSVADAAFTCSSASDASSPVDSKGKGCGKGLPYFERILVGIEDDCKFFAVRRLIGPGGKHVNEILACCPGVKIWICGRGSRSWEDTQGPLTICVGALQAAAFEKAVGSVRELLRKIRKEHANFIARTT